MSDLLRVILEGVQLNPSGEAALLAHYLVAARAVIPPATASQIRLVFRRTAEGTTIEPFLRSAALDALVQNKKRRTETLALLSTLLACAMSTSDNVTLLFASERSPATTDVRDMPLERLVALASFERGRYRIAASRFWFHFAQVKGRLLHPLAVADDELATRLVQAFWVRAVDPAIAKSAIEACLAADGATVVKYGNMQREVPPPDASSLGSVRTSAPVYFRDTRKKA